MDATPLPPLNINFAEQSRQLGELLEAIYGTAEKFGIAEVHLLTPKPILYCETATGTEDGRCAPIYSGSADRNALKAAYHNAGNNLHLAGCQGTLRISSQLNGRDRRYDLPLRVFEAPSAAAAVVAAAIDEAMLPADLNISGFCRALRSAVRSDYASTATFDYTKQRARRAVKKLLGYEPEPCDLPNPLPLQCLIPSRETARKSSDCGNPGLTPA